MPFYQEMRRPHPLRGNRLRFSAPGHPGRRFELADQQLVDRGDQMINATVTAAARARLSACSSPRQR